jgi:8-oxo-dGTP pyrophosphatase MutT (NUDIX family)
VKTRTETSAGCVCFRAAGNSFEVALIRTHEGRWQLPKGWIEADETPEQAAAREAREEAGVESEIVAPLETITYWYVSNYEAEPARIHKFVHFFLARATGGSVDDHDDEVLEARWFAIDEAERTLSHRDERKVVAKARAMLEAAATA